MKLNIKPLLRQKGITQTALAEAVGIQRGYMSEIISGKKDPSHDTLIKIFAALDADPSEAFGAQKNLPPAADTFALTIEPSGGFAESQARLWEGMPAISPDDINHPIKIAQSKLKHPIAYEVTKSLASLALLRGDVLVVDLGQPMRDGDLILIGVADATGHETQTLIRRYQSPFAISAEAGDTQMVINLDTSNTAAWRGTIKAMFRPNI